MQQKIYWLTGASSGIGRQTALLLAAAGHRVYLTARNEHKLQELVRSFPDNLVALPADVSDGQAMQEVFSSLPEDQQPDYLDGLIMAAGVCEYVDLPELDYQRFQRVTATNYLGVVHACQTALPLLLNAAENAAEKPVICGICSMSVLLPFPRAQAYGAAKAAMEYFLQSMQSELQQQIQVTVVYPGFVTTPMTAGNDFPMPFTITAETAASHIVSKLHSGKRRLYFPWQLHWLLKLVGWIPGLWTYVLARKLSRYKPALQ